MHFDCGRLNKLIDHTALTESELRLVLNIEPKDSWRYLQLLEGFYHSLARRDQRRLLEAYPWLRRHLAPPSGQYPLQLSKEHNDI